MRGLLLFAGLFTTLVACSPGPERDTQHAREHARHETAHQGTTSSGNRAETTATIARQTAPTDVLARWDYVALGDSLAAGVGARRGYVPRYAEHLKRDTGVRVRVINRGVSGQTSSQLLRSLRNDPSVRKVISGAEVITLNIGLNDLGQARSSYESGTCGGPQNQACLREAVQRFEGNWNDIIEEISTLRSTQNSIIRTVGLGYTPRTEGVYGPYLGRVTRHIAATDGGIPYVEVRLGDEGLSVDGLHPNDKGYRLIASRLQELGYEPLYPR